MPNNYLIVGAAGANAEYGTDGAEYIGIGTIVSADREDGGDELELKDRQGNVFVIIFFNEHNECTIDVIFDSTVTIPERGDAVDLCGVTDAIVRNIKHKWENTKERMLTITAKRNPQVELS